MTNEAQKLLEQAIKSVGLRGSFIPAEMGGKAGLNKMQAEAAARMLSNAGVLVLGFDMAAHFTRNTASCVVPWKRRRRRKSPLPRRRAKLPAPKASRTNSRFGKKKKLAL